MSRHVIDNRTETNSPEDTRRFGELNAQEEGQAHPSTLAASRQPRGKDTRRLKEYIRIERGQSA